MGLSHICRTCGHCVEFGKRFIGREIFCTRCKTRFMAPGESDAPSSNLVGMTEQRRRPYWVTFLSLFTIIVIPGVLLISGLTSGVTPPMNQGDAAYNPDRAGEMVGAMSFVLLLSSCSLGIGISLWRMKRPGRRFMILVSVFLLLVYPIGTILGLGLIGYLYLTKWYRVAKCVPSRSGQTDSPPEARSGLGSGFQRALVAALAVLVFAFMVAFGGGFVRGWHSAASDRGESPNSDSLQSGDFGEPEAFDLALLEPRPRVESSLPAFSPAVHHSDAMSSAEKAAWIQRQESERQQERAATYRDTAFQALAVSRLPARSSTKGMVGSTPRPTALGTSNPLPQEVTRPTMRVPVRDAYRRLGVTVVLELHNNSTVRGRLLNVDDRVFTVVESSPVGDMTYPIPISSVRSLGVEE